MRQKESIRLFENPLLESLTHVSPLLPILMWGPVIAYLLFRSSFVDRLPLAIIAGVGSLALLFWTFAEYLLHRFVFHYHPKSAFLKRVLYLVHGIHHDDPGDATRLVMPPAPALILAAFFYGVFFLLLGPVYAKPFFSFFVMGYLIYDYTHFAIHHIKPRTRVGRYLRRYHLVHHFSESEAKWGVSSPLWDFIFKTTKPR